MGIDVIRAPDRRIHIRDPHEWGNSPGTDYWADFGKDDLAAGGGRDLADSGWEASGFSILDGSGAEMLDASAKGTTGGINFDAASDYLISPTMFGDWEHGLLVQQMLGYFPTKISFECLARFAAGVDEEATGFGFLQDGVDANALVKADHMAYITVDGTDFSLESSAAADAGATKATTPHLFKVVGTFGGTWEWFIDDASQGTLAIVAAQAPYAWGAGTRAAGGANDPVISWLHIWYE
jgi:hypothetical protein